MNNRITELRDQCINKDMADKPWPLVDTEKFAELIIRECIRQCEKDIVPDEDVIEGYNEDWNMALEHSAEQIAAYFGVNE